MSESRVHVYCRVSSASQEDGYSLDTQEAACRAWAAQRNLAVASVAREVWSGGDRHRPSLTRLLERLIRRVLLSYDLDRLSRGGQIDTAVIVDRVESAGASVAFVTVTSSRARPVRFSATSAHSRRTRTREDHRADAAWSPRPGRLGQAPGIAPTPLGYSFNDDKSAVPDSTLTPRQRFGSSSMRSSAGQPSGVSVP